MTANVAEPQGGIDPAVTSPVLASEEAAVTAARNLADRIRDRAAQTDKDRRVPAETIEELMEAGLFGVVLPKVFGGAELGFATLVRTTIEIASACGSTGWVYGVLAGHSWLLNLFPVEAQYEVLADRRALAATVFRLNSTVVEEEGGYRLTGGVGRFCSGVDYASWVIVGSPVQRSGGAPEPRFFLVPRSEIEIVDDWHTVGMRGTGSKTINIPDILIPRHRSVAVQDMMSGTSPGLVLHSGALYRLPFSDIAPFSIVGAPLGMALGAVRVFSQTLQTVHKNAPEADLARESACLARVAAAAAKVDAAIALAISSARQLDRVNDPQALTQVERAAFPRDWAYAVQTARQAVNDIFEAAGGSSIYAQSDIQRYWRDANSGAQHVAFGWDKAMSNFGRTLAGHPPLAFQVKR